MENRLDRGLFQRPDLDIPDVQFVLRHSGDQLIKEGKKKKTKLSSALLFRPHVSRSSFSLLLFLELFPGDQSPAPHAPGLTLSLIFLCATVRMFKWCRGEEKKN